MDFNASLRKAIKTGSVFLGQNRTRECVDEGRAKLVVVAENCRENFPDLIKEPRDLLVHVYQGSSVQLGKACGKPFVVSALAVVDPGDSDILNIKRV
ncbi:MAG: 50S ribosomal protein L30e [Methanomicrobiaceae archaeon]|uniref:Lsu ribosomal protein l30e n=1 Tax=hydrocarbon metagenome TaxID=938273 RepID=A0A0W8FH26_9ZZZZ|nr:50S ribosomal protein L30e [Methanomicrobiaceae archaeon]MDD5419995.1 50S ribosomal protein L30e [Methanomicrobiaceae archaeon]